MKKKFHIHVKSQNSTDSKFNNFVQIKIVVKYFFIQNLYFALGTRHRDRSLPPRRENRRSLSPVLDQRTRNQVRSLSPRRDTRDGRQSLSPRRHARDDRRSRSPRRDSRDDRRNRHQRHSQEQRNENSSSLRF